VARGDEDTVEPPPRGFCSTALQALRGRQYVAVLLFYLLNLFYRCMQSWRNAELKWKDQQITEAGGQGLDVILQLNTFTSMGASIHLVVIPIFGWLVARFGSDHAPVVVSTGRLAGLEAYPHRLDPAHLQCPRQRQFFLSTFYAYVSTTFPPEVFATLAGLPPLFAGASSFLVTPLLGLVLREFAGDFTVMIMIQLCIAAAMLGLSCFGWLRQRLFPTAAVHT